MCVTYVRNVEMNKYPLPIAKLVIHLEMKKYL